MLSAGQWWVLTLGVGLLAGFLSVLVMLPNPDSEVRTGVWHDWPESVTDKDMVRLRVAFVTAGIVPGPNVTFEFVPNALQGVVFDSTKPFSAANFLPDGTIQMTVPSDPIQSRGEYQTELFFKPTQVGSYQIRVRYRIGDGLSSEFVATGQVTAGAAQGFREPVRLWD